MKIEPEQAVVWSARRVQTPTSIVIVSSEEAPAMMATATRRGSHREFRVLRTAGLEAESALAFAALHRLLRPALDRVGALPTPQRRALRVAFGEEEGDHLDPFLVALATLTLLTELGESEPVLCLVDDLRWLDAAFRDALLFVARRLLAKRVAIVFAARDDETRPFPSPLDVPELPLPPLAAPAVRSLLEEHPRQRR